MSGRGRGSRGRGGRGGGRGRGSSRGRGGRGGRGGFGRGGGSAWASPATTNNTESDKTEETSIDIHNDLQAFFRGTASVDQHIDAQNKDRNYYSAGLLVLIKSGVEIQQNAKARALAAAWARGDHILAESLLKMKESFGVVEVLKAVNILDAARRIRQEEKTLKRLQVQTGGKVKPKLLGKFKSNVDNLAAMKPKIGSASGAVCKHIADWVRSSFTKSELEFYALHFPADPWKKLADICHFHAERDFPELPWFLPFAFGTPAPEGSMVRNAKDLTAENVNDVLKEFSVPFAHVKPLKDSLNNDSKAKIADTDLLEQVMWNYEDLECDDVDKIIEDRIKRGDKLDLPYGKLMERLLTIKMIREGISLTGSSYYQRQKQTPIKNPTKAEFLKLLIPVAQKKLAEIHLPLEHPVVVIGDRSSSMDVAIRTSTIIGSLLTAICSAKLVFFNNENMEPDFVPTNIEEVLKMAMTITACACTAPAASLYPFYERKEVVKTFIMVTDEEENTPYKGYRFLQLFEKYRAEVYPSKLIFVSFLYNQTSKGQMVSSLEKNNIPVTQFKFDRSRPDLTKLDTLFGLLSSESKNFEDQVLDMENRIKNNGVETVFSEVSGNDRDLKKTDRPKKVKKTNAATETKKADDKDVVNKQTPEQGEPMETEQGAVKIEENKDSAVKETAVDNNDEEYFDVDEESTPVIDVKTKSAASNVKTAVADEKVTKTDMDSTKADVNATPTVDNDKSGSAKASNMAASTTDEWEVVEKDDMATSWAVPSADEFVDAPSDGKVASAKKEAW